MGGNIGKKKKIAMLCVLCTQLLFSVQIFANGNENTGIEFQSGTQAVILDPDYPNKEWNGLPSERPSTANEKGMVFLAVPNLNFGSSNDFDFVDTQFHLKNPTRPFVQVSDLRGTGTGWKITIQASSFVNRLEEENILEGVTLHMENGSLLTSNKAMMASGNVPILPQSIVIECGDGASPKTIMDASITSADKIGRGMGSWIARWYPQTPEGFFDEARFIEDGQQNSKIWLNIPADEQKNGEFVSVLYWTLADAP